MNPPFDPAFIAFEATAASRPAICARSRVLAKATLERRHQAPIIVFDGRTSEADRGRFSRHHR